MRAGIGICVECRQVICKECTTQFDGINRCAACLANLSRQHSQRAEGKAWGAGTVFGMLVSFAGVFGVVYLFARLLAS